MLLQVEKLGERHWFEHFAKNRLFYFSQQVVHYSLLTDRFVATGELKPHPLNTLMILISYPIPRKV